MTTAAQTATPPAGQPGAQTATPKPATSRRPWTPSQIVLTLLGAVVSVVILAPLAWALFTSLKSETESVEVPTHWLPDHWTGQAWKAIFDTGNITNWLVNSF